MLHLVGQLLIQISDARNHKHEKTTDTVYSVVDVHAVIIFV